MKKLLNSRQKTSDKKTTLLITTHSLSLQWNRHLKANAINMQGFVESGNSPLSATATW